LPGLVNGTKPRRKRETETRAVSKMGTARTRMGASQPACGETAFTWSFSAKVATKKPNSIAPPSPIKIFAGLKFHFKNPSVAPRTAAESVVTSTCPLRLARIAKNNDAIAAIPAQTPSI
jgi:hypothetical protein